jgi:hypothetical protein
MANNLIQIKRSASTGTPSSLNPGELAYSNAVGGSGVLFIGSTDGGTVVPIGGARTPGTLTANQALVANSTSGINRILAANVDLNILNANGGPGTSGYVLFSGGSGSNAYWAGAGGLGVNTAAQYSFTNTISFSNTITFTTSILANTINATSYTAGVYGSSADGFLANSTTIAVGNSTVNGMITSNSSVTYFTGTANNANYLGGTAASSYATQSYVTSQGYITSSALSGYATQSYADSSASSYASTAYSNAMADTLTRNATYTGNTTFNSANHSITGTNTYISSNTTITGTNTVISSNVFITGSSLAAPAISLGGSIIPTSNISYDLGNSSNAFRSLYVGGTTVYLGSLTLKDSSGTLQVNAASGGAASGLAVSNLTLSTNTLTVGTGSYFVSNGNVGIGNNAPTDKLSVNGTTNLGANVVIGGTNVYATSAVLNVKDIIASGNLTVQGTLTTIDTNNLQVKDNSIKVADGQAGSGTYTDQQDFAVYGTYGNTANTWYAGFYRDHAASTGTNPVFKIFASNTEPSGVVDNTAPGYNLGTVNAWLTTGAFVANSTVVNITANSTVSSALVANSLTLSSALAASYGGTGQTSYSTGDLLYASSSSALSKLSVPGSAANGQVLMITNNLPAYGTLDGGTF